MSEFYTDLRDNTVQPLIEEFGQDVTRIRKTSTDTWEKKYNHVTFTNYWENTDTHEIVYEEPAETVETTIKAGVFTDYKQEQIDDTLIQRGDKQLLTIEFDKPLLGDTYNDGVNVYNYIDHETISPSTTVVLYKIQLRR